MAIDHGLGGRNSDKSKHKRKKKAAVAKKLVMASGAVSTGPKGTSEVTFDPTARLNFIQGFRKRKQERRKHGLTMEVLRQQRERREARKALRQDPVNAGKGAFHDPDIGGQEESGDESDDESEKKESDAMERLEFADDHTQGMFEGAVTVEVDTGIDDDMDASLRNYGFDSKAEMDRLLELKQDKDKGPSRYEKAAASVKSTMGSSAKRKKKDGPKGAKKANDSYANAKKTKNDSANLLRRAVGDRAPAFKGKPKKGRGARGRGKH